MGGYESLERMESYGRFSSRRHSEIQNPAVLDRIIGEIQKVRYLHSVVVALGGAPEEVQFKEAREYFGRLRTPDRDVK